MSFLFDYYSWLVMVNSKNSNYLAGSKFVTINLILITGLSYVEKVAAAIIAVYLHDI